MWNREGTTHPNVAEKAPLPTAGPAALPQRPAEVRDVRVATLGSSVTVKGTVTGSEDLTVDGQVEGRIELPAHVLNIGPNASVTADIIAKVVTVFGTVKGKITAHDSLDIRRGATVEGEVTCNRISIQDGAAFCGKVAMGQRATKPKGTVDATAPTLAAAV